MSENTEPKDRRVISWKQADLNLCRVAAAFIQSIQGWRIESGHDHWEDHEDAGYSEALEAEEERPVQPLEDIPMDTGGRQYPIGVWEHNRFVSIWTSGDHGCPQCFYSLLNLTRVVVKKQRLMIYRNLFGKGEKFKTSKQSSRNPTGRGSSKHGFRND